MNLVSAKYSKDDEKIDWDTEGDFSDILRQAFTAWYGFQVYDHVEEEWVTIRSHDAHKMIVTLQSESGSVWSEDWCSNFWFHCEYKEKIVIPSHYAPVAPLSERTTILMTLARNVGVPAWMILNNPEAKKLVVKK